MYELKPNSTKKMIWSNKKGLTFIEMFVIKEKQQAADSN